MKTKRLSKLMAWLLTLAMLMTFVPVSADEAPTEKWTAVAAAAFAGGNGTVDNPYQIATAEQLAKLAVDVNSGVYGKTHSAEYFILTADIDLGGKLWTPIGTGTTEGSYHSFDGYFDGNNKTISNMYVDESASGSSAGLFGNMYARGSDNTDVDVDYVVKDLTIENATVITAGDEYTYAGILAGYASVAYPVNDIKIINCHVSGTVTTTGRAGGLIGSANYMTADNCSADAVVTGKGFTGGFVGDLFYPAVSNCTAKGTVNGTWSAGGFAGVITNQLSTDTAGVKNCYSYADVTASDWNTGGFAGYVGGTDIEKCTAYGDVTSTVTNWLPKHGGFAGSLEPCIGYRGNDYTETYYASLTNCYYAGTLTSEHPSIPSSGLAAVVTDGTITDCAYDGEKNPDIKGYADEESTTALSTSETGSAICENVFDGHDMDENTCTVCGYTEYSIILGSVRVTNVNAADILGNDTASYDEENNTLTLDGCTAYGDNQSLSALDVTDDLTIVLKGENYLCGVDGNTNVSAGIKVVGNLTIKGTGSLEAVGGDGNDSGERSAGIYITGGNLVIEGGCTVNAKAKSALYYSTGIYAEEGIYSDRGKVTINSSTVKAVADSVTSSGPSYGIQAIDIEFNEATVTASGNDSWASVLHPTLNYANGYSWKSSESDGELSTSEIDWDVDDITNYLYIEPIAVATVKFKAVDAYDNAELPSEKTALAGTKFNILDEDENVIREGLETAEGTLAEATLEAGAAYRIVVTKPSDGFAIPQAIDFTIDEAGNVEAAGGNCYDNIIAIELQSCVIQLFTPAGSKFNITYEDDNNETQTLLTHEIIITGVAQLIGFKHETDYTITFETAPAGYNLPDDVKFRFDDKGVLEVTDFGRHAASDTSMGIDVVYTLEESEIPRRPSGGGGTTRYTVKFETNGGSTVASKTVTRNATLAEPEAPTKDGYSFIGWFTDEELTTAYDFDTKVTKGFTLYAKWEKVDDEKPVEFENPFTDVKDDDWFYEDVKYATENGLFTGTTNTTFAPNGIITRAMMVTVLYRAEGEPEVTGEATFEDVDENAYYAKAVVWGQQNGIIKGYSETEFAPDDNIIREQIAAIIFRYAQYKDVAPTGAWAIRLDYADLADISDYAVDGVMYCKLKEIMQGKGNNNFAPKDNATRAEIAAILHRFIEANK